MPHLKCTSPRRNSPIAGKLPRGQPSGKPDRNEGLAHFRSTYQPAPRQNRLIGDPSHKDFSFMDRDFPCRLRCSALAEKHGDTPPSALFSPQGAVPLRFSRFCEPSGGDLSGRDRNANGFRWRPWARLLPLGSRFTGGKTAGRQSRKCRFARLRQRTEFTRRASHGRRHRVSAHAQPSVNG